MDMELLQLPEEGGMGTPGGEVNDGWVGIESPRISALHCFQ